MSIPTKRLDDLDPTFSPERDHEVAAMRDGISNKLRVEQILALLQSSDIPDAAVTLANLAADARAAANHTFNDTIAQLGETDVQGAINVLALGYRLRGTPIKIEESGTYTPDAEVKAIIIELQAGGGAGAGGSVSTSSDTRACSGGNAGNYIMAFTDEPEVLTIEIGAGGVGAGSAGAEGGQTSAVGATIELQARGGAGGGRGEQTSRFSVARPSSTNSADTVTGAVLIKSYNGTLGGTGFSIGSAFSSTGHVGGFGGLGGSSKLGTAFHQRAESKASGTYSQAGNNADQFGAGGGGALVVGGSASGGNGGDGVAIIWEFI